MPFTGRARAAVAITAATLTLGATAARAAAPNPLDVVTRDATALLAPKAYAPAVAGFQGSWTDRALGLQYSLAGDMPFRNAPWIGTHNSFNSIAEMGPTLSTLDSNQQLSLTDQLGLDVRSLELDVHWFPDLRDLKLTQAPVVCHAEDNHLGCSIERQLSSVAGEIAVWLRAHPGQVLLLYVEDHMDSQTGYDAGASALRAAFGSLLYTPPAGGACTALPLDLTRHAVLAAGAQVVIVSRCGQGTAWPGVAFNWSSHLETRPVGFQDYPSCGPDFTRAQYDSQIVRYFEDSTFLTAATTPLGQATEDDGITPATAAAMMRCGVDLIGMDQLKPGDGRLDALVWSWAPGQPGATGDCALQQANARWQAADCTAQHRVACRAADGSWSVPAATVAEADAAAACQAAGATFAAPRTGYENQLARAAAGTDAVWLADVRSGGSWAALDSR